MDATLVILFAIASLVAILARRAHVPYTVALVLVGLAVGGLHVVDAPHLTKELLFAVFLPGLVFEAAYNIHASELRSNWRLVTALAGPGVIAVIALTTAFVATALHVFGVHGGLTWQSILVFAALVAATDPIAVVGVFRQVGTARRLTTVVEAESLFNDGTSIVILSLVLAYVTGTSSSAGALTLQFLGVVGGGALLGTALGAALSRLTKQIDDPMVEITLTVIAAYGSFVLAERLHLSGVIATVCAGLVLGTHGREVSMSEATRLSVDAFWEYVAFAMNSVVFLLIGFQVHPMSLVQSGILICIAFVAVVLARFCVVSAVSLMMRRTSERVPRGWIGIITWGGLRGALSMVLALALPADFPNREILVDMTFGIVLLSLCVQGLTMGLVATRLASTVEPS